MTNIISGPIGQILTVIVVLVVYSLIAGSINGWYTQTIDAGVVGSERFDRVVGADATETADAAWAGSTLQSGTAAAFANGTIYKLSNSSGNCNVTATGGTSASLKAYTPAGTEVEISSGAVSNCKWKAAAKVLRAGGLGAVVVIVLQAAALALPVGVLAMVGMFGSSMMSRVGGGPLMTIISAVVIVVLGAILFNYFIPFVDAAYQSIDPNRMVVYDTGLGSLGVVVGNFWGVSLVAGMMAVAWTLISQLRGGNMLSGAGKGRQRM